MRSRPDPRASWPSDDDNTGFNLIVLVLGCAVGAALLWTAFHGKVSAAVLALFDHEIAFIRLFTDRYDAMGQLTCASDPNAVTLADLYRISHATGMFFRIPAAALLLLLAAACTLRAAPARYRRAFDLDGLIREQAKSFRTSAAFMRRCLCLAPPAPGEPRPADYALAPDEWIARFATGLDGSFDETAVWQALSRQLGPRWRGITQASPQVRAMFAVFALHLAEHQAEALRLLGDLSAALGDRDRDKPEGSDWPLALPAAAVAGAEKVLRDTELVAPALAIANRHAYAHTALMALLNAARLQAGVLAPGQFAWLKLVDRPLWYALHSLGSESPGVGRSVHPNPRVEALGARDHWAVERLVGGPVVEPRLHRAIKALRKVAATTRAIGEPS
jgi:intracellular multiplication protein IcmP